MTNQNSKIIMKINLKKPNTYKNKGFAIIESILAISMVMVGILGIMNLLFSSLKWNRDTTNRLVATYLAMEGIEVVKNLIDIDVVESGRPWNATVPNGEHYISYDSNTFDGDGACDILAPEPAFGNRYSCRCESGPCSFSIFERKVIIEEVDTNKIRVESEVKWQGRSKAEKIVLEDIFQNWRE